MHFTVCVSHKCVPIFHYRRSKFRRQLRERGHIVFGPISHLVTNDIPTVPNEMVRGRRRLQIGGAIADHNNVRVVGQLLTDQLDGLALAARVRSGLASIESSIVAVEREKQFVGVHVRQRNAQLFGHRLDETVKAAGDEIDLCVVLAQA